MPYRITQYLKQSLLCNLYTGSLTDAELLESLRKREALTKNNKIHTLITDFSGVESFQISADIRKKAQTIIDTLAAVDPLFSIYFIAPDDATFGSARMWQIPIEHSEQVYIKGNEAEVVAHIKEKYGTETATAAQQWFNRKA